MARSKRKYEPIWQQIKDSGTATLLAHPSMHTRIIKMVTKEKYEDQCWQLMQIESDKKFKLMHTCDSTSISFYFRDDSPINLNSL